MERTLYLFLFTFGCLSALISLVTMIICFCESHLQCQKRTSAKIHPDKNDETVKSDYIDGLSINPMFIVVSN